MTSSAGTLFHGTSIDQDARFSNKEQALLKRTKFPEEFELEVDLHKVDLQAIRPWAAEKIEKILGFEDEIVENMVFNMLEQAEESARRDSRRRSVDPRHLQIQLIGFLGQEASMEFVLELWKKLRSDQEGEFAGQQEMAAEKARVEEVAEEEISRRKRVEERARKILDEERNSRNSREEERDLPRRRRRREYDSSSSDQDSRDYRRKYSSTTTRHRRYSRSRSRSIEFNKDRSRRSRKHRSRSSSRSESPASKRSRSRRDMPKLESPPKTRYRH